MKTAFMRLNVFNRKVWSLAIITAFPASSFSDTITTFEYNTFGQITEMNGPRLDVEDKTFYAYDSDNRLASITNVRGHTTQFQDYNAVGYPETVVDPNGAITTLSYNWRGQVTSQVILSDQGDATTSFEYSPVGLLTRITQPNGSYVAYEYDAARRLIALESASGERIEFTLDLLGQRLETRYQDASATETYAESVRYDELGRLLKRISPFGEETRYDYDANGNQILRTDATNQSWQSSYDALNRLVAQIDPKAGEAKYQYYALDRLTKVTDQKGLSTDYQYDAFGNKTRQISPDTGTTNYDYDAAGNLTRKTDARSVVSEYQYDALNRLTAVTYPAHPEENVQYQYDLVSESSEGIGRLGRITDLSGVTEYSYDGRGNITSKRSLVEAQSYVVAYRYDRANRLVGLTYPDGRVVRYERDEQGNIQRVQTQVSDTAPWVTLADQVSYLPFGGVSEFTYGNGVTQNFAHDQAYRLTGLATQGLGTVLNRQYQYDALNNISQISDAVTPANSQSFVYDELSRLIEAEGGYGALGYQYDVVGNRLSQSKTVGSQNLVETYNYAAGSHRLQQVTEQVGSTTRTRTLQYDANGSLINDQRLDGQQFSLHYNGSNRLSEVDKSSVPLASYLHNALGQRVAKVATDPAQDEHYLYDEQGQLLTVVRRTDNSMSHYVYLDEHRIAMISGLDTTSPSQPLNLTAMSTSPSTAALSWSASTDNVGVTGYRIYRNGVLITTQTGLSYTDTGLAAATNYEYQISAVDAAANVSALSLMDDITTSAVSVFERRVNNGNDDAEEGTAGNVVLTSSDLELAYDAGMGNQHIGIRFTSVQVPANAVITKAYLQFQARDAGSSATELSIMAINEPNTATFTTTTAYGISNRSRVGSVAWSNPPAWVVGQNYQSPDIASLVQSVVNLSGWNSGNAMGFVLTGTGTRNAYAHNGGTTRAPLLHIEYYVGAPVNQAPTVNAGVDQTISLSSPTASLSGSVLDDGRTGYLDVRWSVQSGPGTVIFANQFAASTTATFSAAGVYQLQLRADDSQFVVTDTVTVTVTTPPAPDTLAPSQPQNLTVISSGPNTTALSWSASTDNVGVTGYRIYRNGVLITTQTVLSYSDTGLAAATYYAYQVSAVDAAGNVSALSVMDDITTPLPPDAESPSQPLNLTVNSTGPSTAGLSWSASTDNVGVTGYRIYRNGTLIATPTGLSYADSGLAAATYYAYQVSAVDAAGNVSALSVMDDITTPVVPPSVTVFDRTVSNGNDDAEEATDGRVVLTSSDLELAYDSGMGNQHVGIRFTSVQVPANAVITNAYLQFQANEAGSSVTSLNIMAINEPSTATFTTAAYGVSSRSRVGSVAWSNPPAWVVGQNYQSPDIASLVQSVVNLSGWNTGNAMGFVLTGTGTRTAYSYNSGGTTRAARLHIEYYVPSP